MSTLADPGGARAVTARRLRAGRPAGRHHAVPALATRAWCSAARSRPGTAPGRVTYRRELPGIPSRARLSPDGTLAATTAFVTGDSYLSAGFATRTYVHDLATGTAVHLEDFALTHEGRRITPVDRNYWGVTFLDDDTFYLTVAFDGKPWLAKGSLAHRSVDHRARGAECPSLSPDGTRVAYKKMQPSGGWRIAVLDLADGHRDDCWPRPTASTTRCSGSTTPPSSTACRSPASAAGETDLWAVPADGTGRAPPPRAAGLVGLGRPLNGGPRPSPAGPVQDCLACRAR